MIPFSPRIWAIGAFVGAMLIVLGVFALFGSLDPLSYLLSVWAGFFVVYALYRFGFFAERVSIQLPGSSVETVQKLRKTSGRGRLSPSSEPQYLKTEDIDDADDQIQPEDRVIGIDVDGYAIAYPLSAMSIREIVHESFGDLHVIVTWWPVAYSARAFVFESKDAEEPALSHVRKTLLNSSVLVDERGDSIVQFTGQRLTGTDKGVKLEQIPVTMTNWRAWSDSHPDTEVMSYEGTISEDIFERYYISNRAGLHQQSAPDKRWHDKDIVLGLEIDGDSKAYPYPALIDQPLIHDEIGGTPTLVLQERISATAAAFSRKVGDRNLTFKPDSRNPRRPDSLTTASGKPRSIHYEPWFIKDDQTGSRWRAVTGECVAGELKGTRLEILNSQTGFWFIWSRFYRNSQVLSPPQSNPTNKD